ncbi:DNA polymerase III subunit delta [Corynebacterium anserum]|uniref:DNA-directed DNA polymerase n=1 Tax=Corynebacterium anserum TaxID=2684406 RepID=A0A7G7YMM2_9CORY|nr:DNA polymerase III subunit delta [Corynebacterium anserum]QNH95742.1 DNA polymerase III subunit delta [Corynebacterium anserum]
MNSPKPPAPVNLIVGADEFLAERRRGALVRAARRNAGNPELPVEMHKASDLSAPEIIELLSPSLFADHRIIVVWGVEDVAKDIVEAIESTIVDPAPGVVLILQHTGKGRNKRLVQAWPKLGAQVNSAAELKGRELLSFVESEFRSKKVRVSPDVTQFLVEVVGSDLRELSSAISQLVADTNGAVTVDAVKQYYSGKAEVSGFDVAEYAVSGRTTDAVASARRAIQLGVPPVLLASALSSMVADIAKVAENRRIDPRRNAGEFGMPPWKLEKTLRLARAWSPAAVAQGVQVVAKLDAGVKGQAADVDYAVEEAVRAIAQLVAQRPGSR